MKKYIYLILSTLLIVSAVIMSGFMINSPAADTETLVLEPQTMENTINANGRLQYKSGKQIKAKSAGIMESVSVKNGDTVKKGDTLCTVYKIDDVYTALLSQYTGLSGAEALIGYAADNAASDKLYEELKKYCTVEELVSEYDGTVTDLNYKKDDLFEKNAVIMKITEQKKLEIPVNINEGYIGSIKKGQKAEIRFNAVKDKSYTGRVTKIADEAAVTGGLTGRETTIEVIITLDKDDGELRPGYSASCTITLSEDKDIIVLPYERVFSDEKGDFVFTAENGAARKRYITTGREYKDCVRITKGLSEGDEVINGVSDLYDGQKIKVTKRTVQGND